MKRPVARKTRRVIPKPKQRVTVRTCIRTHAQLVSLVDAHLAKTGETLTAFGARALGDHGLLSRIMSRKNYRVSLETVDKILSAIEKKK